MKSKVAPSEANASVVKLSGIEIPPPLLPSSTDYGCCFSCESIEHIRLYLSVLEFIILISNDVPCKFSQMDV